MPKFYEFFAGGGMARAGLGSDWTCLFANDIDTGKARSYCDNWGERELIIGDIASLSTASLPGEADLVWASFPCQDLSLAGNGAGLQGERSGTYRVFWHLMQRLIQESRAPKMIVLENVCGTLTSHQGNDFATICNNFEMDGYWVGAIVVNASLFLPQSRPRLFIIGVLRELGVVDELLSGLPSATWHTESMRRAYGKLPSSTKQSWVWWKLPLPLKRVSRLVDVLEEEPHDVSWFTRAETDRLLSLMSPLNQAKVRAARVAGQKIVGCVYKRTRPNEEGKRVQRAEVRFDDVSGCLRTPTGGSSRQIIIMVDGQNVKARLISGRETARLMGLEDSYILPNKYNDTYHLTGDGVAVPVVRHLAKYIFEPILAGATQRMIAAA
jgi:DNA (cytosine-5)-methyltransferase 1